MFKLERNSTALVVVDVQEKLIKAMETGVYAAMRDNIIRLVKGFGIVGSEVLVTQQYTKGLGNTVSEIAEFTTGDYFEKTSFSCCGEKSFVDALNSKGIKTVVLSGMETHVCVLQTAVDLIDAGFNVHLAADAVCSRSNFNRDTGIRFIERAGAVITCTETVLFQLAKDASSPDFKEISNLVK